MQIRRSGVATQVARSRGDDEGLVWLILALFIGGLIRLYFVLRTDFPLNDGGLFYAMVRDLQKAHYFLPASMSYNQAGLPFAYPPLAFYVAGLLNDLTPMTLVDVFRFLPTLISLGTIAAFYFPARAMLSSRNAAGLAVVSFALMPESTLWFIMGGGLTRGLGFLFAILALWQIYLLYRTEDARHVPWAIICCGGAVLSHPEMALFVAYSAALFFIAYGRNRAGVKHSTLVVLGTLAVSAPWWGTVLFRYGASPLVAAGRGQGVWSILNGVIALLLLSVSGETPFAVLGALALLGVLLCLRDRKFLLPAWVVIIFLLDPRSAHSIVTVPLALLVGIGENDVLLPLLKGRTETTDLSPAASAEIAPGEDGTFALSGLSKGVLTSVLVCAICSVLIFQASSLGSLSAGERTAMQWIAANTPPSSTFIVVTADPWAFDRSSEWFPTLAERVSIGTVQGYEWAKAPELARRVLRSASLQQCAAGEPDCLEQWAKEAGLTFTHVYVPKRAVVQDTTSTQDCCSGIRNALATDPGYRLIYDGPGAAVFERRSDSGS